MTSQQTNCIVADPGDDLDHINITFNSAPVLPYQDSTLIGVFGPKITVSRQDLQTGYWISDSPEQEISPEQERLESGFHDPPVSKPYWVSYDVPQDRYWVDTPHSHHVFSERTQALCLASIMAQTELREMESHSDLVPVEIAALGQSYIAAYLHTIPECSNSKIVEMMGLAEGTVAQYISEAARMQR